MYYAHLSIAAVAACVLIFAGVSKLVDPNPLGSTLGRLTGRSAPISSRLVRALALLEIAGGMLSCVLGGVGAAIAVLLLGVAFAAAGVAALAKGLAIPCNCLGGPKRNLDSQLGRRQVLLLPAWAFASFAVLQVPTVRLEHRFIVLNLVLIGIAGVSVYKAARLVGPYRLERLATAPGTHSGQNTTIEGASWHSLHW